jgi:hypothetical protein
MTITDFIAQQRSAAKKPTADIRVVGPVGMAA